MAIDELNAQASSSGQGRQVRADGRRRSGRSEDGSAVAQKFIDAR
jgi:hypothetical protein